MFALIHQERDRSDGTHFSRGWINKAKKALKLSFSYPHINTNVCLLVCLYHFFLFKSKNSSEAKQPDPLTLRDLKAFSLEKRRLRVDLTASKHEKCNIQVDWGGLFSVAYSDRMSSNRQKLEHRTFILTQGRTSLSIVTVHYHRLLRDSVESSPGILRTHLGTFHRDLL